MLSSRLKALVTPTTHRMEMNRLMVLESVQPSRNPKNRRTAVITI